MLRVWLISLLMSAYKQDVCALSRAAVLTAGVLPVHLSRRSALGGVSYSYRIENLDYVMRSVVATENIQEFICREMTCFVR